MSGWRKAPLPAPAPVVVVREPDPPPIVLNQEPAPVVEAPLFADPKNGLVYIQMGAVEKGVSVIFAEGLRKHGLTAFVAPGPNDKIFRVLIGPAAGTLAAYGEAPRTTRSTRSACRRSREAVPELSRAIRVVM